MHSSHLRYPKQEGIPNAEIVNVQFGILSSEEIEKRSAVEVTESNLRRTGIVQRGSVNDPMLGTTRWSQLCGTCVNDMISCPGHSGHMKLALPVVNAEFVLHIQKILQSVCFWCCRLLFPEDYPRYGQITDIQNPKKRLTKIAKFCEDRKFCESWKRSLDRRKRRKQNENHEYFPEPEYCGGRQPKIVKSDKITFEAHFELTNEDYEKWKQNLAWTAPTFTPQDLRNILNFISDETARKLGYDPVHAHPRNMIWDNFYIPPVTIRPSNGIMMNRSRGEEDLTLRLKNIVKANQVLKGKLQKAEPTLRSVNFAKYVFGGKTSSCWKSLFEEETPEVEQPCMAFYLLLVRLIATYQNAKLKGKGIQYGREKKSIRCKFTGQKQARVRKDVIGKRMNQCARSVITPDPFMHINQVGIPKRVCMKLTYPERVCMWNIHRLTAAVRRGPLGYPGSNYVEYDTGDRIDLQFRDRNSIKLQIGWIVHRHLVDGDYILFNRQPTLHKPSMMVLRIRVTDNADSFRLHLAVTSGFNADFDGDEMNGLPLLSAEVCAEGSNLMLTEQCMLKDGSPIVQFVQHPLVGFYLMSDPREEIPYHMALHILFQNQYWDVSRLPKKAPMVSGRDLLACVFPQTLFVRRENLVIEAGQMKSGRLDKKTVNGHQGLLHVIVQDFGGKFAANFVSGMYNLMDAYLTWKGLSMSIEDCEVEIDEKVEEKAKTYVQTAESISLEGLNPRDRSIQQNNACLLLDRYRDLLGDNGLKQMKENPRRNGLCEMVYSGAKGNPTNIVQIGVCLGQQRNDRSQRFKKTTSHFRFQKGERSRAHGMVKSNFLDGCSPVEMFFHFASARVGLVDTAVRTAVTGYTHRRIAKAMEDAFVDTLGTVRNGNKQILQFVYAQDGFDSTFLEKVPPNYDTWTFMVFRSAP